MKPGISLVEMAQKIETLATQKHDMIVDTRSTMVTLDANNVPQIDLPKAQVLRSSVTKTFPIQPIAHKQLATYTKIPADYYARMQQTQPELLARNINTWLAANPEKRMLRTLDGKARAWLSNRYQRIENEEIAQAALPVIMALPRVQVVSCEVTERKLYIHFVVPTIEGEVKRGDVVQAGGIISNSEVGYGSASVTGLIWRLICLNGMKTADAFRRSHIGRKVEESEELWQDDTRKADDRAILLKVRDMVKAVVDETRFRANLTQLQGLTEGKITGSPEKAVEVLARKIGATEAERGGLLRSLIEGGDLTRWGIVNAVTHQAHAAANYDRAVEFESEGGKLVHLPKGEWKEILEAA